MFTHAPKLFVIRAANSTAPAGAMAVRAPGGSGSATRPLLRMPAAGIVAGTLVETAEGWRPVETLAPGMRVQTWDGGLQPLQRVVRHRLAPAAPLLRVAGGTLSTCSDLWLLPRQHVMVETGAAAERLDCDMALVPAGALDGLDGVRLERPRRGLDVLGLAFDAEEIVYANTGALLHCPAAGVPVVAAPMSDFFTVLDAEAARAMLGLWAPPAGAPALPTPMPGARAA